MLFLPQNTPRRRFFANFFAFCVVSGDDFREDHPDLGCAGDLFLFSADEEALFGVELLFFEFNGEEKCFLFELFCSGEFFEDPSDFCQFSEAEEIAPLGSGRPIEFSAPVDEVPCGQFLLCDTVSVETAEEVELFGGEREQILQQFSVSGLFVMEPEEVREEDRVIGDKGFCVVRFRSVEDARGDSSVFLREGRKEVDAPFDDIEAAEGDGVDLGFESEIAEPETAVPFRAVEQDSLHAVAQSSLSGAVEFRLFRGEVRKGRNEVADCGTRSETDVLKDESIRGGDHFHKHIPHGIDAGQCIGLRHIVESDDFVLNPGAAEGSGISPVPLRDFQRSFCEEQSQPDRGVVEISLRAQGQFEFADQFFSEIKDEAVPVFERPIRERFPSRDFLHSPALPGGGIADWFDKSDW